MCLDFIFVIVQFVVLPNQSKYVKHSLRFYFFKAAWYLPQPTHTKWKKSIVFSFRKRVLTVENTIDPSLSLYPHTNSAVPYRIQKKKKRKEKIGLWFILGMIFCFRSLSFLFGCWIAKDGSLPPGKLGRKGQLKNPFILFPKFAFLSFLSFPVFVFSYFLGKLDKLKRIHLFKKETSHYY